LFAPEPFQQNVFQTALRRSPKLTASRERHKENYRMCVRLDHEPHSVFIVTDDDSDYTRLAGVAVDGNNFFSIVFASAISQDLVKSDAQLQPNQWFHIALVQKEGAGRLRIYRHPCLELIRMVLQARDRWNKTYGLMVNVR
jgi:hypothetical protein